MSNTAQQLADTFLLGAAAQNGNLVQVSGNTVVLATTSVAGAVQTSMPLANGSQATVVLEGRAIVRLVSGLTPTVGMNLYLSSTAGLATTVPGTIALGYVRRVISTTLVIAELVIGTTNTTVASWGSAVTRYYAVDYNGGNDSNLGYSDVSLAAAGAVAVKTLTQLKAIVPSVGNGCKVAIVVKGNTDGTSLTYYKPDGVTVDDLDFRGLTGYALFLARTTTSFTNDATDKSVLAPAQGQVGPNSDGSFTVAGGATISSFTIAAGTLTAEPGVLGMRVRFTGNVTTALASQSRMIWYNTGTVITPGRDLSVAPAAGDTFYIERPGVVVDNIFMGQTMAGMGTDQAQQQFAVTLAGFRALQSTIYAYFWGALSSRAAFLEFDKLFSCRDVLRLQVDMQYVDESGTTITVGAGIRHDQQRTIIVSAGAFMVWRDSFTQATTNSGVNFSRMIAYTIGAGCVFYNCRLQMIAMGFAGDSTSQSFGNDGLGRRTRFTGVNGSTTVAPLTFSAGSNVRLSGVDISNAIAVPCISFQANRKCAFGLRDVVSTDGGNTGFVIEMNFLGSTTRNSSFVWGSANTITATAGDIKDANGVALTFAQINATHAYDGFGNDYGSGAATDQPLTRRSAGIFYNVPILTADPATLLDGDVWITDIATVRKICCRIGGATYRTTLT